MNLFEEKKENKYSSDNLSTWVTDNHVGQDRVDASSQSKGKVVPCISSCWNLQIPIKVGEKSMETSLEFDHNSSNFQFTIA